MSALVHCDWCSLITDCERRSSDEWVCPECWAHHLEQVGELYAADDGPCEEDERGGQG